MCPIPPDDFAAGRTDAVAVFERALNNWRGSTGVNFDQNNKRCRYGHDTGPVESCPGYAQPDGGIGVTNLICQ